MKNDPVLTNPVHHIRRGQYGNITVVLVHCVGCNIEISTSGCRLQYLSECLFGAVGLPQSFSFISLRPKWAVSPGVVPRRFWRRWTRGGYPIVRVLLVVCKLTTLHLGRDDRREGEYGLPSLASGGVSIRTRDRYFAAGSDGATKTQCH